MLYITVPAVEQWDERTERFVATRKEKTLQLEHSLVSISKWESKWRKPFLTKKPMTTEETIDYIKCMTITQNVDPEVYERLGQKNIDLITDYIGDPMTATFFSEDKNSKKNNEIITNEVIYCWMIGLGIPHEYEKWHLNRLLTLIRVCNDKNSPPKKKSKNEIMRSNSELNKARRKALHTKG